MARTQHEPSTGSAFMGAAAASFATGPTLILTYGIYAMLTDPNAADMDIRELGSIGSFIGLSSFICLIGSIPAAALNAIALSHLVHRAKDAAWWAITSGGIIGVLVLLILSDLVDSTPDFLVALWFAATGALMGLVHWRIAIRPRRRWRLRLLLGRKRSVRWNSDAAQIARVAPSSHFAVFASTSGVIVSRTRLW